MTDPARACGIDSSASHPSNPVKAFAKHRLSKFELAAFSILLINVSLIIYAFYPGFLGTDSIYQYLQALNVLHVSDYHPPIMVLVWQTLMRIFSSKSFGLIFLFHMVLMFIGLWFTFLGAYRLTGKKECLVIVLIPLFPQILGISAAIWKDVGHGFSLLAGFGIPLYSWSTPQLNRAQKAILLTISMLLLFYGFMARHNSFIAVMPLIWLTLLVFLQRKKLLTLGLTLAVFLCFVSGNIMINRLLSVDRARLVQNLFVFDLAGISVIENKDLLPSEIKTEHANLHSLKKYFSPVQISSITWKAPEGGLIAPAKNAEQVREIGKLWIRTLCDYPFAYLQHRLAHFASLMRIGYLRPFDSFFWGMMSYQGQAENIGKIVDAGGQPPEFHPNLVTKLFIFYIVMMNSVGIPFYPWIYFIMNVVGLFFTAGKLRSSRSYDLDVAEKKVLLAAFVLFLSAVIYHCMYLVISVSSDFRYSYWPVIVASVIYAPVLLHFLTGLVDFGRFFRRTSIGMAPR